jgi:hypothetical protein
MVLVTVTLNENLREIRQNTKLCSLIYSWALKLICKTAKNLKYCKSKLMWRQPKNQNGGQIRKNKVLVRLNDNLKEICRNNKLLNLVYNWALKSTCETTKNLKYCKINLI